MPAADTERLSRELREAIEAEDSIAAATLADQLDAAKQAESRMVHS